MSSYGFRVYGIPTQQGSKIPAVSSKGKKYVRETTGQRLVDWRTDVKEAALLARGDMPTMLGAVKLSIRFFMPRPASVKPAKRPYPIVAPDLDKLIRAVGDALKAAGVYKDDCQIVAIQATEQYASDEKDLSPGAWIVVSEIL